MPDKLLTPEQAAAHIGVAPHTLANWRCNRRVEIPFIKVSHKVVRYRLSVLDAWLEAQTRR